MKRRENTTRTCKEVGKAQETKQRTHSRHTLEQQIAKWMDGKGVTPKEKKEKEEQEKGEDQGSCRRSQRSQEQQEGAAEEESGADTHKPDTLEQLLENGWMQKKTTNGKQRRKKKNR